MFPNLSRDQIVCFEAMPIQDFFDMDEGTFAVVDSLEDRLSGSIFKYNSLFETKAQEYDISMINLEKIHVLLKLQLRVKSLAFQSHQQTLQYMSPDDDQDLLVFP
jgi:hypothetical protein